MGSEYFDHLTAICHHYDIPKENLVVVDDVANAAVELGWEPEGTDKDRRRLAKIKHDMEPPIILLKRKIDWNYATALARQIPCKPEVKKRRIESGLDRRWFLTHLILHEIAHYVLNHHKKGKDDYTDVSSEYEVRFLKEREADRWAIDEIDKHRFV